MDCSTAAAQQHLDSGHKTLKTIVGEDQAQLDAAIARVRDAYRRLSPADRVQVPQVQQLVRRHVWPRRLWRTIKAIIVIVIFSGIAWLVWKIVPNIEY
jgi:hypothetical protein